MESEREVNGVEKTQGIQCTRFGEWSWVGAETEQTNLTETFEHKWKNQNRDCVRHKIKNVWSWKGDVT